MVRIVADRFVVEELVGSGGMGEVFRAKDRLTGGHVALKVLYASQRARALRDTERFAREAQILAEINHPRIVRYVAHGVASGLLPERAEGAEIGRPFIALEWLEGEDLAERLDREGLTLRESLVLARRCSEGLAVLHEKGVVHRDIKPSNVFLPGKSVEQAKLLDLGVARQVHATRPSTRTGVMVGTPGYMAPEQARGAKEIDARADVFALGCLLYECLGGQPAFSGENIAALLAKILLEDPPPLRELGVAVPDELDELVLRMLSKHAAARPASGVAVLAELDRLGVVKDAPAQRASARAIRALTAGERRHVSVVMASLADEDGGGGALSEESAAGEPSAREATPPPSTLETLAATIDPQTVVASFGGEVEILADGSIVVTFAGKGGAGTGRGLGDEVAHAARCARVPVDRVIAVGI